jgi:hypothetical protein
VSDNFLVTLTEPNNAIDTAFLSGEPVSIDGLPGRYRITAIEMTLIAGEEVKWEVYGVPYQGGEEAK